MCGQGHLTRPQRLAGGLLWFLALALTAWLYALPARAQSPDLEMPAWDLCEGPNRSQMACFTQDEVRQLLRVQEHARYYHQLSELNEALQARFESMIRELQSAQVRYQELRDVIEERNVSLRESLAEARAETERYRGRLERRRIWPWVSLGLGLVAGAIGGVLLAN